MTSLACQFCSVYGPVTSWRYGRSLGIDPIGQRSTCSFDCLYCQLGEIEERTHHRQTFVSTEQILNDLAAFAPWDVDVITISGSGEPTLALNLGEIIPQIQELTRRSVGVLTNGSLLIDPAVRWALQSADYIAVKLDAFSPDLFQWINHPIAGITWSDIRTGIRAMRREYHRHLAIQTMLMNPWNETDQIAYIAFLQNLAPDEVQLNVPTRPRPLYHVIESRGNSVAPTCLYPCRLPRSVSRAVLQEFGDRIHQTTGIPVRYPPIA